MKKLSYPIEALILILWIPCVVLIFKLIPEKKVAALFAGAGFLLWPILFLVRELLQKKSGGNFSKLHALICIEFLFFSSLPIFLLRVLNWNEDFSSLSVMGIRADFLHRFSNVNYLILMSSVGYQAVKAWRNRNEKSQP